MLWNEQIGRRIKLRDLHYLLTVVQAGSMAKAATLLSVSQPVVSKIIADMEHNLRVRLLDRSPRGVEPTIYGRRLLDSAYAVFDELRQGVIEIDHLNDPAAGELSIGSNEASTLGIVPTVIARIRKKHPRLFIQVVMANTAAEQFRELSQRKIEFAIGRIWTLPGDKDFDTEILFEQDLFVVAGAHNDLTRQRKLNLADLMESPWVMPSQASVAGQLASDVFRACDLEPPRSAVVASSFQLIQRLLEDGPFLALLPASTIPALTRNSTLQIMPVDFPRQPSAVGITKLRSRRLSPVAEIFIDAARAAAAEMRVPEKKVSKRSGK